MEYTVSHPAHGDWTKTIVWENGERSVEARCPACGEEGGKPVRLVVAVSFDPHVDSPLVICPHCGTAFYPELDQPPYEALIDPLWDFYLEQNAGIDVMADALASVDPAGVHRYMELGCGFGFLLDYTRTMYGWQAKGFDPGHAASLGREALKVDIEHIYVQSPADAGPEPYDVVLCSEVIEHVLDPHRLLTILRDTITPEGVLLLTTPSAAAISPETQSGRLLSLLSPGSHFVLFSAKGLETALRQAGYTDVRVIDRGHALCAAASCGTLRADLTRRLDRDVYAAYLRARVASTEGETSLGIGFRYRLLKETANRGHYTEAKRAAAILAEAFAKKWSFDANDPAALLDFAKKAPHPASVADYHASAPFCLGGYCYFRGILAWLGDGKREEAAVWFEAAASAGERTRTALHLIGSDDGETEELAWRALGLAAHALAWTRPAEAADQFERLATWKSPRLGEAMPQALWRSMAVGLFVDLVNLGRSREAERFAKAVTEQLDNGLVTGAEEASLTHALGMYNLNHAGDRIAAIRFFGHCVTAAARLELEDLRHSAEVHAQKAKASQGGTSPRGAQSTVKRLAGLFRERVAGRLRRS